MKIKFIKMKARGGKREGDKAMHRGKGYTYGSRLKSRINSFNTSLFNCAAAAKYCAIVIIFLLFCFAAIASANEATKNVTAPKKKYEMP